MVFIIYNPITTLVVVSFIVSLLSTLVMKFTIDKHKMKSVKERMEKIKNRLKDKSIKEDPEKFNKLMKEQYALLGEQMRLSFKSMFISLAFLLPFYYYLSKALGSMSFTLPFPLPFIGKEVSWLVLYIFYSLVFSFVLKKLLDVEF